VILLVRALDSSAHEKVNESAIELVPQLVLQSVLELGPPLVLQSVLELELQLVRQSLTVRLHVCNAPFLGITVCNSASSYYLHLFALLLRLIVERDLGA
jgi:hypothetical protein